MNLIRIDTYVKCPKCRELFKVKQSATINTQTESAAEIRCECGFRMKIESQINSTMVDIEKD